MGKGLFFITAIGVGVGAFYLMDEKKGKKRRAKLRNKVKESVNVAGDFWNDYSKVISRKATELSHEYGPIAQDYGRKLGSTAAVYSKEFGQKANTYLSNGHASWAPSARMAGALGSALAFYGAGRKGFVGTFLRTLSLGMFTRALIASR